MSSVSAVQTAILARAKQVLGDKLHYEALPATADLDAQLSARAKKLPAVFVAFFGGQMIGGNEVVLDAEFGVLVVTQAVSERDRREGSARMLGAVPMLEVLVPALHGHVVPEIGSLGLTAVTNLFAQALDEKGLSLYAANYRIKLPMALDADPADELDDLRHIHGDWMIDRPVDPDAPLPLSDGFSSAVDVVTLQGEP